jgi:hypothetical protein
VETLSKILGDLAGDLKDDAPGNAFVGYPEPLLIQWFNDGLCLLARWRPDLFARTREVVLAPGSQQEVVDCGVFGSVVSTVLPDGREVPARRTNYTASQVWTKPSCLRPAGQYIVDSYSFDTAQKTTFYVHPPVPPGKPVRAKVVCAQTPPNLSVADLDQDVDADCYQVAMVKHYVLAQAYSQDTDQTNLPLATFHLGIWNSFLPAAARADAAFAGGAASQPQVQPGQARR